jgi:2-phospho-L-lactate transferase/gluconeogenesis factor (CofD/UPF0052 family)
MYQVNYDYYSGTPISIQRDVTTSIPIDIRNSDFIDFLVWNAAQETPLDYTTLVPYVFTPTELAISARKAGAKTNAGKAIELKNVPANQAVNNLEKQVHSGTSESALDSEIDATTTIAELQVVIKKLAKMVYAQTKANQTSLRLLLAVADETIPDR